MGRSHKRRRRSSTPDLDYLYEQIKKIKNRRDGERELRSRSHGRRRSHERDGRDYEDSSEEENMSMYRRHYYLDSDESALLAESPRRSPLEETEEKSPINAGDDKSQPQDPGVSQDKEDPLDQETLQLLGEKVSDEDNGEIKLHSELADRWKNWLQQGLKEEVKQELNKRHPRKGNCRLEAPKVNPELEASLNETVLKRDKFFASDQNTLATAMSAVGEGLSQLLTKKWEEVDRDLLLLNLADAGKLLSEVHFQMSKARKAFIYPSLDKKAKEILSKEKSDEFLFGQELSAKIKSAKSMERVGLTLKSQLVAKKTLSSSKSGNRRGSSGRSQTQSQAGYKLRTYYQASQNHRYRQDKSYHPAPRIPFQPKPRENQRAAVPK